MLNDYLAGWFDAVGQVFTVKKGKRHYPIIRVTSKQEGIPRLFEMEYGGAVRTSNGRWVWEAARRDVVYKFATAMTSLSLLMGAVLGLVLTLQDSKDADSDAIVNGIKDLGQKGQS